VNHKTAQLDGCCAGSNPRQENFGSGFRWQAEFDEKANLG
jgi:hypothetical protein